MTNREIINQNFLSQLYQKKKEVFKTKMPSEGVTTATYIVFCRCM